MAGSTTAPNGWKRTADLIPFTSDKTVLGRFYLSVATPAGYQTVWLEGDGVATYAQYVGVYLYDTGTFGLFAPTSPNVDIYTAISPGWHRWAYVRRGLDHKLYLDGTEVVGPNGATGDVSTWPMVEVWLGTDSLDDDPSKHAFIREYDFAKLLPEVEEEFGLHTYDTNVWLDTPFISSPIGKTGRDWTEVGTVYYTEVNWTQILVNETIEEIYSDIALKDPGDYYGGYKEPRTEKWGVSERSLSDLRTGELTGSTFTYRLSDHDLRIRKQLASWRSRFFTKNIEVKMTSIPNRNALGAAYTVFNGPVLSIQPREPASVEFTLSDQLFAGILSDNVKIPWRQIGDGPLSLLTTVVEGLDKSAPEPIGYGSHQRIPDVDPASPEGFVYTPILLGKRSLGGVPYYAWLCFGHAIKEITNTLRITTSADKLSVTVASVIADEGTKWFIPTMAGYLGQFGASYEDLRSDTYGDIRRYTIIYGKVGEADPDACADGTSRLAIAFKGIESIGDGSGTFISSRILQLRHFLINYVANQGHESYHTGIWLSNPFWDLQDDSAQMIDELSFDACDTIALARLPPDGYPGAWVIKDRNVARKLVADACRSSFLMVGADRLGSIRAVTIHPTPTMKAAVALYDHKYKILDRSFNTTIRYDQWANHVPFKCDYEHTTGEWKTFNAYLDVESIWSYDKDLATDTIDYPTAPGITAGYHVARLLGLVLRYQPRIISFEAEIGPDAFGNSLGYLDLGDYFRYKHYASIAATAYSERLAMVIKHQVQVGERKVLVEALDVEDLIGFDDYMAEGVFDPAPPVGFPEEPPETRNDTCANAIVLPGTIPYQGYVYEQNVAAHATDTTPPAPHDAAFRAAWFKFTPDNTVDATISTQGSDYDTVLVVYTGSCGALTEAYSNDNDDLIGVNTSQLNTLTLALGVDYFILVYGYFETPDGTNLKFSIGATEI